MITVQRMKCILVIYTIFLFDNFVSLQIPGPTKFLNAFRNLIKSNPLIQIVSNSYSFFYWLPRRNLVFDRPFEYFKNSSVDFISWYQIPHNLPPYRYLVSRYFSPTLPCLFSLRTILFIQGNAHPSDFFCYGLPGSTLPLGNWDPWGLHQVSEKVVRKYRESEIKHGRLAMLGTVGMIVQEQYHPLHEDIGGLAITHMDQLYSSNSILRDFVNSDIFLGELIQVSFYNARSIPLMRVIVILIQGLDYKFVIFFICFPEIIALQKNWIRWKRDEYNHQFDHNIGIGNLKQVLISLSSF
jgi:Chlorophyll A-B binding protein